MYSFLLACHITDMFHKPRLPYPCLLCGTVPFLPPPPRCGLPLVYRHTDMDSKVSFVMSGAVVGGGTGGAVEERKPQASNAKGKKSGKVRAEAGL